MKTAYPAIMHEEENMYWLEFPDLDGCFCDGHTIAETLTNAENVLGAYLCSMMERGISLPMASDIKTLNAVDGFSTMIATDTKKYHHSTKAIKKTLSIPEWLNVEAEKRHINFSSVLQQALISMIE